MDKPVLQDVLSLVSDNAKGVRLEICSLMAVTIFADELIR